MEPMLRKQSGSHYTPRELANFVASQVLNLLPASGRIRLLDPAVGDGQLVHSILNQRKRGQLFDTTVFDINGEALAEATRVIASTVVPAETLTAERKDFLADFDLSVSSSSAYPEYDACISNPPYGLK
jgi:methylase of polypeptide subunit release factors